MQLANQRGVVSRSSRADGDVKALFFVVCRATNTADQSGMTVPTTYLLRRSAALSSAVKIIVLVNARVNIYD